MKRNESAECAERLWALAEPLRLRIVQRLFEGPCHVSELCEATGEEMVTVSHHLKKLRDAEIVNWERVGQHVVYRLREDVAAVCDNGTACAIDLGCCRLEFDDSPPRGKRRTR